jgi:HEAT repeat protein
MANETLEERNIKVLEGYINYARKRDSRLFVQDDTARSAARQLGELKSKAAVQLLVQCVIVTNSYDAGLTFRGALIAIGRPALVTIETALSNSGFGGFRIHPGGPARGNLVTAKESIIDTLRSQE